MSEPSSKGVILKAAGAYTADSNVIVKQNGHKYCHLVIDITEFTAGSLTVTIQGFDPASGKKYTILASAALAAVATTVLKVGPALTAAANLVANDALPHEINVFFDHADATSITYSAGLSLMP